MAFSIFFSITIILCISYVVTKRNLHLFEILFMWMIIIIIDHNVLTITALNMSMVAFSKQPGNYWTLVLNRMVLIPLLIVWYFDNTLSDKPYKKWGWLPAGILILIGVEYLGDVLHIYRHIRWKIWWSVIEWFVIFLVVNYTWIWFRNVLRKEMDDAPIQHRF